MLVSGWNYIAFSLVEQYKQANTKFRSFIYVHNGTSSLIAENNGPNLASALDNSGTYSIEICGGGCTGVLG